MSRPGFLLTFEGGEGCGKSTQLRSLAHELEAAGVVVRVVREPGHTRLGEAVRALLLDPDSGGLDARAELLLYEAARAQLVAEVIEPALDAGETVICDRFYDSSTAYQGYGRGLSAQRVAQLNEFATGGVVPDRTIVLDIDPQVGLVRATTAGADRLEREELLFHQRVRDGFLSIAREEPHRVRVVDGSGTIEQVGAAIRAALRDVPHLSRALGVSK